MDDAIDPLVLHEPVESVEVADVHLDKLVVGLVLDVLEVSEVTGISELVEVDDVVFWIFIDEQSNNVTSDEASTTSDYYVSFHFDFSFERELQ